MADIAYEAGIKAILQHFTGAITLDGEIYAITVDDSYTPDSTDETMSDIIPLWDGEFDSTANSIVNAVVLYDGTTTAQVTIDIVNNKVMIQCDDIAFGTVTDLGGATNGDPAYVVLFLQEDGTDAAGMSYPLGCLKAEWEPAMETYTFVVDTDGIVLWDPQ